MKTILIVLLSLFGIAGDQIPPFQLIQEDDGASCFRHTVQDSKGDEVKLPKRVKKGLDCPYSIGLHGVFLSYVVDLEVRLYNLEAQEDHLLFTLYDDIDGFSSPAWTKDGRKVAYIVINQEQNHGYKSFCRIVYCELKEDGALLKKRKFDRPVNFECGSICSAEPEVDFMFDEADQLIYRNHLMYTDGEEIWDPIEL